MPYPVMWPASPFCRKRAAEPPSSAPGRTESQGSGNHKSPAEVTDLVPELPPPLTKPKRHRSAPVDDNIEVLLKAFGAGRTTNDVAAQMLRAMVPSCLGPAKHTRDDLQSRACHIVGSELSDMENEYLRIIQVYQDMIAKITSTIEIRISSKAVCQNQLQEILNEETSLVAMLKEIQRAISQQTGYQQEAQNAALVSQKQLNDYKSTFDAFMVIFNKHFIILREDFRAHWQQHAMKMKTIEGGEWISGKCQQLEEVHKELEVFIDLFEHRSTLVQGSQTVKDVHLFEYLKKLDGEWLFELVKLIEKKHKFQEAKHYFKSLKDDDTLDVASRQSLITKLIDLFKGELDCEDCLVAGFEPAAVQPSAQRGSWSRHVFEVLDRIMNEQIDQLDSSIASLNATLEDFMTKRMEDLKTQLARLEQQFIAELEAFMTGRKEEMSRRLHELEMACDANQSETIKAELAELQHEEAEIIEKLKLIRQRKSKLEKIIVRWESILTGATHKMETIKMEISKVSAALESFRSGALTAYNWLLEHSAAESNLVPEESSVAVYDPEVQARIRIVQEAVKNLPERSWKCKEMIARSASGCLCPQASNRRKSQADQCLVVGAALEEREGLVKQAVQQQFELILQACNMQISHSIVSAALDVGTQEDEAKKPSGENGMSLVSHLVIEKEEMRQKAILHHADVMKALPEVQNGLKSAMQEYDAAVSALSSAQDVIRTHFVSVKGDASMTDFEAEQHIGQLMKLLEEQWHFEECLLAGLGPALKHRPARRSNWCMEVIDETEQLIEKSIAQLHSKVEAKKGEMTEWNVKVETARRNIEIATKERDVAEQAYELMRGLMVFVKELSNFRLTAIFAYNWLHMHGFTQSLIEHKSLLSIVVKEFCCEVETVEVVEHFQSFESATPTEQFISF